MITRFVVASLIFAVAAYAADDTPAQPTAREMLKARLAEEAKNAPTNATAGKGAPAGASGNATTSATPSGNPIVATGPGTPAEPTATKPKAPAEPATVMPKVEVKKGRITELDQQLAKQEQDIAREKKNTKPSEVDKALNDSKIAKPLAIFGGESTQFRQRVSSERVSLMEDEKDLIEAIAHAKTKAEKAELQKQLDALRAERRELEKALR